MNGMITPTLHLELSNDPSPVVTAWPGEHDAIDLGDEALSAPGEGAAFPAALVERLGMAPADGARLVGAVRWHDLMRQAVADAYMPRVRDLAKRLRLSLQDAEGGGTRAPRRRGPLTGRARGRPSDLGVDRRLPPPQPLAHHPPLLERQAGEARRDPALGVPGRQAARDLDDLPQRLLLRPAVDGRVGHRPRVRM
jgi:hypothetical protein